MSAPPPPELPAPGRVVTEPLGGSPLSLAVQTGGLPHALQPWRPAGEDEWRAHVDRRRSAAPPGWLDRIRDALAPGAAAEERLRRVAAAGGVVVTTGQQPGLFGGPLYTLAKALTALELADAVEAATGVPTAPVFWAATDDADFLEASVTFVADPDGLHALSHDNRPAAGTLLSAAPLGDLASQLDVLRAACGSAPHARFLDLARAAYAGDATIGGAYVRFLRGLLEPLGIAVLDASDESYRAAARPVLAEALAQAAAVAGALAERAVALRELGFEPQVEDDRGLSLVFAVEHGVRRRLTIQEARSAAALDGALAPNVLLRPVVEREVLPTVAYVGGPGELAYFVQSDAVAAALGRERLVSVPRWSVTVVEPFVERALARLGVTARELRELPAVERRLAGASLPGGVARSWQQLADQLAAAVQDVARAVNDASLMPPTVIEGLSRSLAHRLSRTERRLLAAAKRRNDAVRRDLACASAAVWPRGKRQERMLNFVPMLSRGGPGLLDAMRRAAADHARQLLGARQAASAGTR